MPRYKLDYTVTVDSPDEQDARLYLSKLRDTFRLISEELVSWGFTGDETQSFSDISQVEE
jgi:hypothetical protein